MVGYGVDPIFHGSTTGGGGTGTLAPRHFLAREEKEPGNEAMEMVQVRSYSCTGRSVSLGQ